MNLSEFTLNLSIASLITLMALNFLSILNFHTEKLEQKIMLEDTAMQALIILEQSLDSSTLSYCTSIDKITNHTDELNSKSRYQWQNGKLTTYQKTPAAYLENKLTTKQITLTLNFAPQSPWLVLDDCKHAILSTIITSTKIGSNYTITLNHTIGTTLQPPIMVGTINLTQFDLDNRGLYRKINTNNRTLIFNNITKIDISKNTLMLSAQNHDAHIEFQKAL